jgi:hypothetical protein
VLNYAGSMTVRGILAAVAALALLAVQAPASGAAVHRCGTPRFGVWHVSARNMTCRRAIRLIYRVRYVRNAPRLRGWRCRTIAQHGEDATQRCARGSRAFRWGTGG